MLERAQEALGAEKGRAGGGCSQERLTVAVARLGCRWVADTLLQQGSLRMMVQRVPLIPEKVGGALSHVGEEHGTAAALTARRRQ